MPPSRIPSENTNHINHRADFIMVTDVMLHQFKIEYQREVERSATRQFVCYWRVRPLRTIMRCVIFITCQWKLKYKVEYFYEILFIIINTFFEIAIRYQFRPVIILHERQYKKDDLHLNLSYTNWTELVLWDGMLHCAKPLPETMSSFSNGSFTNFLSKTICLFLLL